MVSKPLFCLIGCGAVVSVLYGYEVVYTSPRHAVRHFLALLVPLPALPFLLFPRLWPRSGLIYAALGLFAGTVTWQAANAVARLLRLEPWSCVLLLAVVALSVSALLVFHVCRCSTLFCDSGFPDP
jgi:hypothetical protein